MVMASNSSVPSATGTKALGLRGTAPEDLSILRFFFFFFNQSRDNANKGFI